MQWEPIGVCSERGAPQWTWILFWLENYFFMEIFSLSRLFFQPSVVSHGALLPKLHWKLAFTFGQRLTPFFFPRILCSLFSDRPPPPMTSTSAEVIIPPQKQLSHLKLAGIIASVSWSHSMVNSITGQKRAAPAWHKLFIELTSECSIWTRWDVWSSMIVM